MYRGRIGRHVDGAGRCASCDPSRRGHVKRAAGLVLAVLLLVVGGQGGAGHSVGHYPILLSRRDPHRRGRSRRRRQWPHRRDAARLRRRAPRSFAGPVPEHVKSVKSLGSFLVLSFNAASARFASADDRCAAARGILAAAQRGEGGRLRLPSLSRDALSRRLPAPPGPDRGGNAAPLARIGGARACEGRRQGPARRGDRARSAGTAGGRAEVIVSRWCRSTIWSAGAGVQLDGWSGPPWVKEGWFHAHRLLAAGLDAAAARGSRMRPIERLIRGAGARLGGARRIWSGAWWPRSPIVAGAWWSAMRRREEYFNEAYPRGRREHRLRLR